jgi:hypothetical protein
LSKNTTTGKPLVTSLFRFLPRQEEVRRVTKEEEQFLRTGRITKVFLLSGKGED